MNMWGAKWDRVEFISSTLFPWDTERYKNSLNKQPKNNVITIIGSLKYLHCDSILIIVISEKKESNGGTEKFPQRIIIRKRLKIGTQFSMGDLK